MHPMITSRSPERATTLKLPIPAETLSGTICANAFITVQQVGLKLAEARNDAGKIGFTKQPSGAYNLDRACNIRVLRY